MLNTNAFARGNYSRITSAYLLGGYANEHTRTGSSFGAAVVGTGSGRRNKIVQLFCPSRNFVLPGAFYNKYKREFCIFNRISWRNKFAICLIKLCLEEG